jgi:hypothetical protein
MVETGATPRKRWRRSTWAVAIGSGLALLVICLAWLRQGDMPWPLVAVAVGWIVLAPPIYDHSGPAIAFLILTALAAVLIVWIYQMSRQPCSSPDVCIYGAVAYLLLAVIILVLWFLGGAILALIRLLVHRCPACRTAFMAYDSECPSCGLRLRNVVEPSAVRSEPPAAPASPRIRPRDRP